MGTGQMELSTIIPWSLVCCSPEATLGSFCRCGNLICAMVYVWLRLIEFRGGTNCNVGCSFFKEGNV
uniref:Uncharacterized protein n=1 Tax=Aegilops tauschii subsp. strangulata TaxID=200361 RepID=A0A453B3I4_AEGTS